MERITVSAPLLNAWRCSITPEKGSEEQRLVRMLKQPQLWAGGVYLTRRPLTQNLMQLVQRIAS